MWALLSTTRAFNRCDARLRISILFDKERVFTTDLHLKASPDHSFMGPLSQNALYSQELMIIGQLWIRWMGVDGVFGVGGADVQVNIFRGDAQGTQRSAKHTPVAGWDCNMHVYVCVWVCSGSGRDPNSPRLLPPTETEMLWSVDCKLKCTSYLFFFCLVSLLTTYEKVFFLSVIWYKFDIVHLCCKSSQHLTKKIKLTQLGQPDDRKRCRSQSKAYFNDI